MPDRSVEVIRDAIATMEDVSKGGLTIEERSSVVKKLQSEGVTASIRDILIHDRQGQSTEEERSAIREFAQKSIEYVKSATEGLSESEANDVKADLARAMQDIYSEGRPKLSSALSNVKPKPRDGEESPLNKPKKGIKPDIQEPKGEMELIFSALIALITGDLSGLTNALSGNRQVSEDERNVSQGQAPEITHGSEKSNEQEKPSHSERHSGNDKHQSAVDELRKLREDGINLGEIQSMQKNAEIVKNHLETKDEKLSPEEQKILESARTLTDGKTKVADIDSAIDKLIESNNKHVANDAHREFHKAAQLISDSSKDNISLDETVKVTEAAQVAKNYLEGKSKTGSKLTSEEHVMLTSASMLAEKRTSTKNDVDVSAEHFAIAYEKSKEPASLPRSHQSGNSLAHIDPQAEQEQKLVRLRPDTVLSDVPTGILKEGQVSHEYIGINGGQRLPRLDTLPNGASKQAEVKPSMTDTNPGVENAGKDAVGAIALGSMGIRDDKLDQSIDSPSRTVHQSLEALRSAAEYQAKLDGKDDKEIKANGDSAVSTVISSASSNPSQLQQEAERMTAEIAASNETRSNWQNAIKAIMADPLKISGLDLIKGTMAEANGEEKAANNYVVQIQGKSAMINH